MYLSPPSQETNIKRSNSEPDFQNNMSQCSRPRGSSRLSAVSTESRERCGSKDNSHVTAASIASPDDSSFSSDNLSVKAHDGSNTSIDSSHLKIQSPSQAEVKAQAYERLNEELAKAQKELKLKDEECEKLMRIRTEIETELEDLTAALFQEAHAMVHDANLKESFAKKKFVEANNKVEILQAEVTALKTLVITSTPSKPGIIRSQSTEHVNYCPECGSKHCQSLLEPHVAHTKAGKSWEANSLAVDDIDEKEVDVLLFKEFLDWMDERAVSHDQPFLARIYAEDVAPCLSFNNKELAIGVLSAIENHTILMETLGPRGIRRKCSLTDTSRLCKHHMKLTDQGEWYYICQSARNRIAAVCEFYTYVRYIHQRLVKADVTVIYWQIMKRRAEMSLTRLGFSSKSD